MLRHFCHLRRLQTYAPSSSPQPLFPHHSLLLRPDYLLRAEMSVGNWGRGRSRSEGSQRPPGPTPYRTAEESETQKLTQSYTPRKWQQWALDSGDQALTTVLSRCTLNTHLLHTHPTQSGKHRTCLQMTTHLGQVYSAARWTIGLFIPWLANRNREKENH